MKRTYCVGIAPADACGTGAADRWCEGHWRCRAATTARADCRGDCSGRAEKGVKVKTALRTRTGKQCAAALKLAAAFASVHFKTR